MPGFEALQQDDDSALTRQTGSVVEIFNLRFLKLFVAFITVITALSYGLILFQSPSQLRNPSNPVVHPEMSPKKSIIYHANWANYGRDFQVRDLQSSLPGITDIAYAFFNIKDSGNGNYVIESGDAYFAFIVQFRADNC